jgi:hypothetical protein
MVITVARPSTSLTAATRADCTLVSANAAPAAAASAATTNRFQVFIFASIRKLLPTGLSKLVNASPGGFRRTDERLRRGGYLSIPRTDVTICNDL